MMKRSAMVLALFGLPLALAACRGDASPTPGPATPTSLAGGAPNLTAIQPVVEYRPGELEQGEELEPQDTRALEPGANILTREGGRALVEWPGFLTNDLLTDTDTLLSLSEPGKRQVLLDQLTGTSRFTLEGPGEPATVTVKLNWIDVEVTQAPAEFIVSVVPGETPSAWVVMLQGEGRVTRLAAGAALTDTATAATEPATGAAEDGEGIVVASGQGAGFAESGPAPLVMEVDAALVRAWYDDLARGAARTSILGPAFRCEVTAAETVLLAEPTPDAPVLGDPLTLGTVVEVIRRDEDGAYLQVRPLTARQPGWASAADLACSGPVMALPTSLPGEDLPTPTVPLPTRGPLVVTVPVATIGVPTPTSTPTPTAAAAAEIKFSVDDDEIDAGECTTLRWTVRNVQAYFVNGQGRAGDTGSQEVCPDETTTYTLRVVKVDGSEESRSVTVEVREAEATSPPAPTNPPAPTDPPDPTDPPPTDPPDPTDPPPTDPPAPLSP